MKSKTGEKQRGLFDHISHIRTKKSPDYFDTLSDSEKKSFNHYMICRVLSMDKSVIEEVAFVTKYFDKIDSRNFYILCCNIIPMTNRFFPYIKSKKNKYNEELVELVAKKFEVSTTEATEYIMQLFLDKHGTNILKDICSGFGKTDKEIKKLLEHED
jgi:hypothetical protein